MNIHEVRPLEEIVSAELSKLGIHGTYEIVPDDVNVDYINRTLAFTDSKDQFLFELYGGQALFASIFSTWGKQVFTYYRDGGIGIRK